MADWSKPALTDTYSNFLTFLSNRLNDALLGADPATTSVTNPPTSALRWNSASSKWQKWSGAAWADLSSTYAIAITGNAATATTASACPWSGITSKPTTVAGFGISDGETTTHASATYQLISNMGLYGLLSSANFTILQVGGSNVGTKEVLQNSKSANYTTVLADNGKHLLHPSADVTARTFTIDSNANVAQPIGATHVFVNQNGAGVLSIAITTDTMRLAGPGTTGTRTLAANGVATALKLTATEWIISGTGLT